MERQLISAVLTELSCSHKVDPQQMSQNKSFELKYLYFCIDKNELNLFACYAEWYESEYMLPSAQTVTMTLILSTSTS